MTQIDSILKRLPRLKTAEDFADVLADLERGHTEAAAALADLEARRESALFDGGDLTALESDISAAARQARILGTALTGAKRRRDEAAESERMARLEATGATARKLNTKLRARLIAFGENAETLAGHAEAIKTLRAEINTANNTAREGGRGDLVMLDPIRDLVEIVGRQVADPVMGLNIPEFYPYRAEGGAALARLRK